MRTKKSQVRATDEEQVMAMINMSMCYISKTQQKTIDQTYSLDHIKSSGVPISTGYKWKPKFTKKRKWLPKGEDELSSSVKKQKNYSKVTPELIGHMYEWIGNYPQVVKSPIPNDTFLVPDTERPGKKIRFSKLILHIWICEIHNYLISDGSIYKLKDMVYETTGKSLISDTSLIEIMPKNIRKITYRYKQMCRWEICFIICYMQASLSPCRFQHLNLLRENDRT